MMKMKNAVLSATFLMLLTASAFAEPGKFSVSSSIYSDALGVTAWSGDYTDKDKANYQGAPDIVVLPLGSSIFDTDSVNDDLNVNFSYEDEEGLFGGRMQLVGPVNGLRKGPVQLGWFGAWVQPVYFFKLYVGNEFQRGIMSRYRYANFNDFVMQGSIEKDFGPIYFSKPTAANISGGLPLDAGFAIHRPNAFAGGIIFTLDFEKVTVELGSQNVSTTVEPPFYNLTSAVKSGTAEKWDYGTSDFGFKARVDVADIAGILNLEAVAHYNGTYIAYDDAEGAAKDGVTGVSASRDHTIMFGAYANVKPIPSLGITVGYSGQNQFKFSDTYAAGTGASTATKDVYPFWHGINLNTYFTGIKNVRLTFNNNLSFANIEYDSDADTTVHGIYTSTLASGIKDHWLAYYAGLDAKYVLNEKLTLDAAVTNKIGIATVENSSGSINYTYDSLSAYAGVIYRVAKPATIEAGLAFNRTAYKSDAKDAPAEYGALRFGIPLRFTIKY